MSDAAVNGIPKIIHRTWKTRDIPHDIFRREWVESWAAFNPEWRFEFYTDADIAAFIQKHFPEDVAMFEGYDAHIKRVDAFRYFLLYKYGGMYVDLDFECFRPLSTLFEPDKQVYLQLNNPDTLRVTNAVMISAPGHELWRHAIERLRREQDMDEPANVHTGPHFLTRALGDTAAQDIRLLEFGAYFFPRGYQHKATRPNEDYRAREDVYGEHKFAGTW